MRKRNTGALKIGPKTRKLLVLLQAGIALSLTTRPDAFFKIIKSASREMDAINRRTLRNAINSLYQSKLIGYRENSDGTVTLILTEQGKEKALRYNLDTIMIKKPLRWDEWWRVVMFDIPERMKAGRTALALKLQQLGFFPMQKSVYIFPYECKNEIDFIVEIFELKPYVRFLLVKESDIDPDLRQRFNLQP